MNDEIEILYSEFSPEVRESVKVLSVMPSLTDVFAKHIISELIGEYETDLVLDEIKSYPIWFRRSNYTWGILEKLRMVALRELNGDSQKVKQEILELVGGQKVEFFTTADEKDALFQRLRLALGIKTSQESAIKKFRSVYDISEKIYSQENLRIIGLYLDESIPPPSNDFEYSDYVLSAYFMQGLNAYRKRDYKRALKFLLPVWKNRTTNKLSLRDAGISSHLVGQIYGRRKKFDLAEEALLESVSLRPMVNDNQGLGQSLHSLGNLYVKKRNRNNAEKSYNHSLEVFRKENDKLAIAQVLHSLGNLYSKTTNSQKLAEQAYLESIELGRQINNFFHEGQALHSLGLLYVRIGEFGMAEKTYLNSIELRPKAKDNRGLAQVYFSLANLYANHLKKYDLAEFYYKESIKIEKKLNNKYGLSLVYPNYAKLAKRKNDLILYKKLLLITLNYVTNRSEINRIKKDLENLG